MRKYTKIIAGIVCAVALTVATSGFAANTVTAPTGTVVQTTQVQSTSLFNAGELGLSLGSGYNVGTVGDIRGKNAFTQPYTLNFNAGVFYFPLKYVGFEANVPFYQSQGTSVSEVQVGTILRLPLATSIPVLKNVAPYVGIGGVYNWNAKSEWAYIGKVGAEYRLNSKWGVYTEGQYRNDTVDNWDKGSAGINVGLHLVF